MARYVFTLLLFCLAIPAFGKIVDSNGNPLPEVLQILRLMEKSTSYKVIPGASAKELTSVLQEKFIRPKGAERLAPASLAHYHHLMKGLSQGNKKKIQALFRKLGDVDPVFPTQKEFDFILINGSTVQNMRKRIMFLSDAIRDGKIKLKVNTQVVFLDGERKLFPSENTENLMNPAPYPIRTGWEAPSQLPTDEREAAELVWNELDLTPALRAKQPLFVHAEKKLTAQRAETEDCVMKWASQYHPQPGTALVVSNNPYIYYQSLLTKVIFKKMGLNGIVLESLGSGTQTGKDTENVDLGLMLDNLARTFYTLTSIHE